MVHALVVDLLDDGIARRVILGAGLRGAGNALTDDDLARMSIEGGLKGAAEIAARLLRATFGEPA